MPGKRGRKKKQKLRDNSEHEEQQTSNKRKTQQESTHANNDSSSIEYEDPSQPTAVDFGETQQNQGASSELVEDTGETIVEGTL